MCFRSLSVALVTAAALYASEPALRVCADPNDLPFSNRQQQGFENKIAERLASTLNRQLEYVWWPERKSLVKQTLNAGRCDVLLGVPSALDSVQTTEPYYQSTYVFITRRDRGPHIASLSDPQLANVRIGIHVVGDDFAPPATALAHRGITNNIKGYSLFGAEGEQDPGRKLIDAVTAGDIDVAIAWGPLGAYFAKNAPVPLDVVPVAPPIYMGIPFTFPISLAVRKGDDQLCRQLQTALSSNAAEVKKILSEYAVPEVH